jgi:8-oxo-dGTP pyrophosphatase MutT (NUDIX family)
MVQRKDSLSYVEYIRGKYTADNKNYLLKLFSNMTMIERNRILKNEFDTLWKELWQINECSSFLKEYNESKTKFEMLRKGYNLKNINNDMTFFDTQYVLENSKCELTQAEWGFPKGRRNINESDFSCAFREFSEETGIPTQHISVVRNINPFEEVFSGSNHVRYKHVYYLAISYANTNYTVNPLNKMQCKEVKDMKWLSYKEAQSLIRPFNVERKELFHRVDQLVLKKISSFNMRCLK